MLRIEGWGVKHKRVERIWRQEGLKVPERLGCGCRRSAEAAVRGHVWSYDFVASRTHDGRALKQRARAWRFSQDHTPRCWPICLDTGLPSI